MKFSCTFLIFFTLSVGAYSQWSSDPSQNTRVTNGGLLPQMMSDGSGGAYVVYQDSPALLRQIWVQRLDRYGFVRFTDHGIPVSGAGRSQTPYYFLVSDSAGGVIVVFEDFHVINEETFQAIYAQRIDSTGAKLWGEVGIEVSPLANGKSPIAACSDGENGAFVFWDEDSDSNGVWELWGQRVSAAGVLMWPGQGVMITNEFTSFNEPEPGTAVSDGSGGAIILYSDSGGTKLQRIGPQGEFLWNGGIEIFPVGRQMMSDGFGGVIVAGVRFVPDSSGYHFAVGAQHVDSEGRVLWGDKGVIITELAHDLTRSVEMVFDRDRNIIFIWHDKRTGNFDIYAQKLNINGEPQWIKDGIKVSGYQSSKSIFFSGIASDQSSGAVIIWSDDRNSQGRLFSPDGLFAQRIDGEGNRLWGDMDVPVSIREVKHNAYKVISDNAGGAIVCWYEVGSHSGWGIFAQQVSRNGNLGEVLATSVSAPVNSVPPKGYFLHQSYPNPSNSEMVIKYQIPKSTTVQLVIYDINGKEMIKLVDKKQSPGNYEVFWNGKNQKGGDVASGIYLYQLRSNGFVITKKALFIK